MTEARKPLLIVGGVVGALIIVTLIASTLRPVEQLDPNTPEGVVQQFIQAVLDDDEDGAEEFVTSAFLDDCAIRDRGTNGRFAINESRTVAAGYLIEVMQSSSEGFGGGYVRTTDIMLVDVDGGWLIDWASWPFGCGHR